MEQTPIRVLVVDDEIGSRESLSMCLELDFDVESCGDGAQAERKLSKHSFEVLVVDYEMPGMTGTELLRRSRRLHPSTVGILVTGHADIEDVKRARKSDDVFLVLLKPYAPEDLLRWVRMAAQTSRLRRASTALGGRMKNS